MKSVLFQLTIAKSMLLW